MQLNELSKRARAWVALGLLGLACSTTTDDDAEGSSSTTSGDASSGASGAGGEDDACPENPRAECTIDCSVNPADCGTETSQWDDRGCSRVACMLDTDCTDGERCFGIGPGEPEVCISLFSCVEDEQRGGCVCGGGATCYPGYCVPR